MWATEMPQDGSGTRSGNALAGGLARFATAGADRNGRLAAARGRCAALADTPQHPDPFTTFTLTLAEASAGEMFSSWA